MSLLDDVSIVVTPNGYKAGELYAVVPVPTEGAEEITNGDFATDLSGWDLQGTNATNTITWETNGARIISTGVNIGMAQTSVLTIGKTYRLTCDVAITVGKIGLDGATSGSTVNMVEGFNEIIFTAISTTFKIKRITGNDNCLLDNVSVKEYTSADMDVTRATAATRVDENGLVNYAEVVSDTELVTNGDFSNGLTDWISQGDNITIDNGTARINRVTNTTFIRQNILTSGKTYLIEFDVLDKPDNNGTFIVRLGFSTTYNVSTYAGTRFSKNIVSSGSDFRIYSSSNNGVVHVDNISVKEVTRDNVPRIDYTGGGCPHILAEPQRTNLITYSEDFSNAVWAEVSGGSASNPVLTNDYAISPDGTENATRCLFDMGSGTTTSDYSRLRYLNLTATTPVISLYIKSNNANTYQLNFSYGGDSTFLVDAKPNEWTRVDKLTIASGSFDYRLELRGGSTSDDTADILIWGAQAEEGSYPTSLIPTSGSTVTRNQDIFTRDGIGSLINSTEGVLFVEMAALSDDNTNRYLTLTNGTTNERVALLFSANTNELRAIIFSSTQSINISFTTSSYNVLNDNKLAIRYKSGEYAFYVNGTSIGTNTASSIFTANTLNRLAFDVGSGSLNLFAKVKQLQVYDTALTDTQLAALTS